MNKSVAFYGYIVYDDGRIWSDYWRKFLTGNLEPRGYLKYRLIIAGTKRSVFSHRIIASIFIPEVPGKDQVNHKNGIKTDNRVENLEWVNHQENQDHAWATGLKQGNKGTICWNSKLTDKAVLEIRELWATGLYRQWVIAEMFEVCRQQISMVVLRKQWTHI